MKKFLKVFAIIVAAAVAVLVAAAAVIAVWQWDNISAFVTALNETPEQTMQKMNENDAALKEELENQLGQQYRELTEEEKQQIESGEVSEKEILAKIISEKAEEGTATDTAEASANEIQPAYGTYGPPAPKETQATKKQSADKIINRYVSTLYSMESRYIGSIEGVLSRAYAEYVRTAKHEQDTAAIASVGAKYIQEIYSLEAQCDGEVETLLGSLKSELDAIGADTSIIATIRSAYANEKQLKRSYYMGKYLN